MTKQEEGTTARERLTSVAARWDSLAVGFQHLEAYRKLEGSSQVGHTYTSPDGFALGAWIAKRFKQTTGNL